MAKIKDIYSNDSYYPFLLFCESHGLSEMKDLAKCPFHKLRSEADVSALLLSKIKAIFISYCRTHTSEFLISKKPAAKPVKKAIPDSEIESELQSYFESNADKLLHITDITKFIGKKSKRSDVVRILAQAPWCKEVDSTTYFYSRP